MVLAKLCMSLPSVINKTLPKPDFHAFIVDHKARVGSHEEAHLVASRLNKMGTTPCESFSCNRLIPKRSAVDHYIVGVANGSQASRA